MQSLQNQSFTRRQYDGCKTNDDLRVTTGPGRYQIDTPPQYCNASFAPEPTIRQQRWGASLNGSFVKTDVESDLLNINRPTTKTICSQYDPGTDEVNQGGRTDMKEQSFPQTFSRLVDPPSTGRAVGWNRWEWLCENPQESVMMPFDWAITTRLSAKDAFRPCIPTPIGPAALLPAPTPFEPKTGGCSPVSTPSRRRVRLASRPWLVLDPCSQGIAAACPPMKMSLNGRSFRWNLLL